MRLNHGAFAKAVYVGAFAKAPDAPQDDVINVNLPEDLSTLSSEELATLTANAMEAFNEVYQGGEVELSADQEATLTALAAAKTALDTEKSKRATASAERASKAAALAAQMAPVTVEPEAAVEPEVELAAEVEPEVEAPADDVSKFAHIPAVSVKRALKATATPVVETPRVAPIFSATSMQDVPGDSAMSMQQVADSFADQISRLPDRDISRLNISARTPIATVIKPFDKRAVVTRDNSVDDAIAFAVNEAGLKGGSLVAAGGWCAPSATVYDMCQLESTDGLLSVPEIQVSRGGIRFTQGPDWADIFASTGFCFNETEDIGGLYASDSANLSITEGGSGLTSFTLTYGGQTTASIPASATAGQIESALDSLSTIGTGNVYVTGPAGASTGPWNVAFIEALANAAITTMTATPTGGSGTVTVAVVNAGGTGIAGPKPTNLVTCPAFTDVRLNVCGVTIQAGNLMDRAYPELVRRYVSGALTAHAHRMATQILTSMIAQSTPVAPTARPNEFAALSPILSAIELEVEDMKYRRRMSRGQTIEAIFPFWVRGLVRADLSRRIGYSDGNASFGVSDAQIGAWFAQRGINPQFIYNFDNLGAPSAALGWPTTVRFLMYPAGTFVRGSSPLITIEMLRDSTLNANNNFTAIFTEEAWSVMKMCPDARLVSVAVSPSGTSSAGYTAAASNTSSI
jgi:hypothetical protein